MANTVEVTLQGKDNTGAAYTSAAAQEKAYQALVDQSARTVEKASTNIQQARFKQVSAASKVLDAERFIDAEAQKATGIQGELDRALSDSSKSASDFSQALGDVGSKLGPMMTPMAGLVATAAALAPVAVTLGFGLGGLALAAVGVVKPIEKAAQSAGGLQANMAKLTPVQQEVARSLLGLQKDYQGFQQALAPTILKDFNAGIAAARPLLAGVEPVARATGTALGGIVAQLGADFHSQEWQQFFGWMAANAPGDVNRLGHAVSDLTMAIPPLVQELQPLATGLLDVTDGASKLIGGGGLLGVAGIEMQAFQSAARGTADPLSNVARTMLGLAGIPLGRFFHTSGQAAGQMAGPMGSLAGRTQSEAQAAKDAAAALNAQREAFIKGLGPLNAYVDATITQRDDLKSLRTALQASGDKIGYNTQKQRDAFGAAQTYIKDLENTATQALASGQGVKAQASAIHAALPVLSSVTGKTSAYRAELAALKAIYDQLKNEPNIVKTFTFRTVGTGGMTHAYPVRAQAHGGIAGAASGGLRSNLTLVGEQGPELVDLAPGSRVHSAPDSQRMLGAPAGVGQVQLVVSAAGQSAFEAFMLKAIREFVRVKGGGDVQKAFGRA